MSVQPLFIVVVGLVVIGLAAAAVLLVVVLTRSARRRTTAVPEVAPAGRVGATAPEGDEQGAADGDRA